MPGCGDVHQELLAIGSHIPTRRTSLDGGISIDRHVDERFPNTRLKGAASPRDLPKEACHQR
jgi:hypothetical protein